MSRLLLIFLLASYCCGALSGQARLGGNVYLLDGITLLQADVDPDAYFYLPRRYKVARHDSLWSISLLKYIWEGAPVSGGLFNVAFKMDPEPEELAAAGRWLQRRHPSAFIKGRIPLFARKGRTGTRLVSSLSPQGKAVTTSSRPPVFSGNELAFGLLLEPGEATLLEKSLVMTSADFAVMSDLYYHAYRQSLSLRITVPTKSFGELARTTTDLRDGFVRRAEQLMRNGGLRIQLTNGAGTVDEKELNAAVVDAVVANLLERFLEEPDAVPDSLHISLADRRPVRVGVTVTGQAGGIVNETNRKTYIRALKVKNDKPREHYFTLDFDAIEAFPHDVSNLEVLFRRDSTSTLRRLALSDTRVQSIRLPRGEKYEYRVAYHLGRVDSVVYSNWQPLEHFTLQITAPLRRKEVEFLLKWADYPDLKYAVCRITGPVAGRRVVLGTIRLQEGKLPETQSLTIYHDPGGHLRLEVDYYRKGQPVEHVTATTILNQFIYLTPSR